MKDLLFGCSTWFFQGTPICSALQTIKECGFQAAEIWMEHLWKTDENVKQIEGLANTLELPLSLHAASYDVKVMTAKHFSEDKRKNAHLTGMLGLNQTEEEKKRGIMRPGWVLLREGKFSSYDTVNVLQCLEIGQPILDSWHPRGRGKKKKEQTKGGK